MSLTPTSLVQWFLLALKRHMTILFSPFRSFSMDMPSSKGRRSTEEINLVEFGMSNYWWLRGKTLLVICHCPVSRRGWVPSSTKFSHLPPKYPARMMYVKGLWALRFLLAAPGAYCIFMSICCWRRVGG
jgi:hypothetical protein